MTANRKIQDALFSILFFMVFALFYGGTRIIFAAAEPASDYTGPSQNLFNLRIPKNLNFAGEAIPQNDYSIKVNMETVINGGSFERSTAFVLFSRASSWFPLIEKILKKNNIPNDFKYIALAESRLTNSTSPQGAVGFWQFVASTGSHYGLEISNEVDERYHVEKSTEAACRFFKEAYRKFGNWTLVAASYNMGMGGIENHLKKQNSASYYDLMMNKETSAYMYRVLALKTLFMNSGRKFTGGRNIYNTATRIFKFDSSITDLEVFAKVQGCDLEILKTFNPWLLTHSLSNPGGKTYLIKLPGKEYIKKLKLVISTDSTLNISDSVRVRTIFPDSVIVKPDSIKTDKNEQPGANR